MRNVETIRTVFNSYGGMMRTGELSREKIYYLDTIPHLFYYNAFLILSNGVEAKVGTLGSKYEFSTSGSA